MTDTDDGNTNGELISEHNVNQAVVGVTYDDPSTTPAGGVTVDGYTATVTVVGADGGETRTVDWGDGATGSVTTDGNGNGSATHTYGAAGDYTVTVADTAGNVLASDTVTVTDPVPPGPTADEPEPEPEPDTE